jgi:hypothetical protein
MDIIIGNEDESQNLIKKVVSLFPKDEEALIPDKSDKLSSNNMLPPNSVKNRIILKKKNNKYEFSNEGLGFTSDSNILSNETCEDSTYQTKPDTLSLKKKEAKKMQNQITIKEEIEEEDENSISDLLKKNSRKPKGKGNNIDKKLCGKKRKNEKSICEDNDSKIENCYKMNKNEDKKDKNKNTENRQLITNQKEKKDESKKILYYKEKLLNLTKKDGFQKVFNCLNIVPLNRKNIIEKNMDDIIKSIGMLRTTLLLLEIKFDYLESKTNDTIDTNNTNDTTNTNNSNSNSNSITDNNIINLEDKNCKSPRAQKPGKEKKDDKKKKQKRINSEKKPNKKYQKTYVKSRLNKSQIEKNNKKQNLSYSPISLSVQKDLELNELELGIHLQKDKYGRIYKFSKKYFSANKGNNIYVFYCSDTRCTCKGWYYVKTMKFETTKNHKLKYEEHNYIKNKKNDKFRQIIEEFEKRNCNEAQIFIKENDQLVKWYD